MRFASPIKNLTKIILCRGCGENKKVKAFYTGDFCKQCLDIRAEREGELYAERINAKYNLQKTGDMAIAPPIVSHETLGFGDGNNNRP